MEKKSPPLDIRLRINPQREPDLYKFIRNKGGLPLRRMNDFVLYVLTQKMKEQTYAKDEQ